MPDSLDDKLEAARRAQQLPWMPGPRAYWLLGLFTCVVIATLGVLTAMGVPVLRPIDAFWLWLSDLGDVAILLFLVAWMVFCIISAVIALRYALAKQHVDVD